MHSVFKAQRPLGSFNDFTSSFPVQRSMSQEKIYEKINGQAPMGSLIKTFEPRENDSLPRKSLVELYGSCGSFNWVFQLGHH